MNSTIPLLAEARCEPVFDHADNRWAALAIGIQNRDARLMEEFYRTFQKGLRYLIRRQLGIDGLEDSVHSCFALIVEALQQGRLREPSRLPAFAGTIVRRHSIARIEEGCFHRRSQGISVEARHGAWRNARFIWRRLTQRFERLSGTAPGIPRDQPPQRRKITVLHGGVPRKVAGQVLHQFHCPRRFAYHGQGERRSVEGVTASRQSEDSPNPAECLLLLPE